MPWQSLLRQPGCAGKQTGIAKASLPLFWSILRRDRQETGLRKPASWIPTGTAMKRDNSWGTVVRFPLRIRCRFVSGRRPWTLITLKRLSGELSLLVETRIRLALLLAGLWPPGQRLRLPGSSVERSCLREPCLRTPARIPFQSGKSKSSQPRVETFIHEAERT